MIYSHFEISNSDAKDSICNWVGLQALFASAAELLHSKHSMYPHLVADTIFSVVVTYMLDNGKEGPASAL